MMWGRNRKIRSPRQWVRDGVAWAAATGRRIARPAAAIAVVVLAALTGWTAWDRLQASPQFRLRELGVDGAVDMTAEQVAAACGLAPGHTNVVLATRGAIRETCVSDPRIRDAAVVVEPPARIRVTIRERRAELYAALPDGLWAVSPLGEIFAPVDPDAMRPLPVLTGAEELLRDDPEPVPPEPEATRDEKLAYRLAVAQREARATRRAALLAEALSLSRVVSRNPVAAWAGQPLALAYDPVMGFSVQPLAGGLAARFGHAPFGRKVVRLKQALEAVEGPQTIATHAYLDNEARPHEVTVRLQPAPEAAATEGTLEALP